MILLIVAGVLMAGFGTAYVASEDVRYLTRAGIEQTKILEAREPITEILRDPATTPARRAQLQLVLDARDFAAEIGYDAKQTYTTYADVGRDTLLLVLSASPRNCLCAHLWKYPIVGRIPYKGFFDPAMARREAGRLEQRGYDIYLRPAGAFSTLGWFNDPLYSTAMSDDSVELAATVLHEIAHNTLYIKSATPFNESFAQLAGYRAAEAFFRRRGSEVAARQAADRWLDEVVLSGYYTTLADRLEVRQGVPVTAVTPRPGGVVVQTPGGIERFDLAVLATTATTARRWAAGPGSNSRARWGGSSGPTPSARWRTARSTTRAWWRRGSTGRGWSCSRRGTRGTAPTSAPRWRRWIP